MNLKSKKKTGEVMTSNSNVNIYSFMQYNCTNCGSRNLHKLEGAKLNDVDMDNRMCRDCRVIMFIKES